MAGVIVLGAYWAGKNTYEVVKHKRAKRKAKRAAGQTLNESDGDSAEDDALAPPPYHEVAATPVQSSSTSQLKVLVLDQQNPILPPNTQADEIRFTYGSDGQLSLGKGCRIGIITSAGGVVLNDDCQVDTLRAQTGVAIGKRCVVRSLVCEGDALIGKDCRIEVAQVAKRLLADPTAIIAKRE